MENAVLYVTYSLLVDEWVRESRLHNDRSRLAAQTINKTNKYCKCSMQIQKHGRVNRHDSFRTPANANRRSTEWKLFVRCKFQYVIPISHGSNKLKQTFCVRIVFDEDFALIASHEACHF